MDFTKFFQKKKDHLDHSLMTVRQKLCEGGRETKNQP